MLHLLASGETRIATPEDMAHGRLDAALLLVSPLERTVGTANTTERADMAASLNQVTLLGNLTRDPEVRELPGGTTCCAISIACNRTWTGNTGDKNEEVSYFDVNCFGRVGQTVGKFLRKGRQVIVTGRLKQDRWETQEGNKRSRVVIVADSVQFLSTGRGGGEGSTQAYGDRPAQGQPADSDHAHHSDMGGDDELPF